MLNVTTLPAIILVNACKALEGILSKAVPTSMNATMKTVVDQTPFVQTSLVVINALAPLGLPVTQSTASALMSTNALLPLAVSTPTVPTHLEVSFAHAHQVLSVTHSTSAQLLVVLMIMSAQHITRALTKHARILVSYQILVLPMRSVKFTNIRHLV
jgi:hypothetical protein